MNAVLVSHPHAAAVSCAAAVALERRGRLATFAVGVAAGHGSWTGRALAVLAKARPVLRNRLVDVPASKVSSAAPVELGARLVAAAARRMGLRGPSTYDAVFAAHDAAVARMRWPRATDVVYAYEDGALATFRRAARCGIERVWDLPLPHYLTIERVIHAEARRWPTALDQPPPVEPPWKRRRKDAELALASVASVASAFTRRSLEEIGFDRPIVVASYGFPVDALGPKTSRSSGPFTALAVGTQDLRKGTPYLLEAWKRAGLRDARLRIVGSLKLAARFLADYTGLYEHVPHMPKASLGEAYRAADVLIFPTLGDGFGLVMQEAMACGTPVITTPCGGGPEVITSGVDGWICPPADLDALVEQLRACARDRERTFATGQAARATAERWTWREAGDAFVDRLCAACSGGATISCAGAGGARV